ncbi:tetratricopeptide repeat protein [Herbidospora sp. RD11066]
MDEIADLIDQAQALPYGEAKTTLLETALQRAEETGDKGLIWAVRMELTEAYQYGAEHAKAFAAFARCLADHDAEPGGFGDWSLHNVLWHFKWIVGDLRRFPEVPLARTHQMLDDMERRYRESGNGLHAVHAARCAHAAHLGDFEQADELYHRWTTTPRDILSDCEGCDPTSKAFYLTLRGRDEEAVALAEPVLSGELTCHVQPQSILTTLLPAYVRTGRYAEAAHAHRVAYRAMRGDANEVEELATHVWFCAVSGNLARGLEIFSRERRLLERAPSPGAAMWFAAAGALLLRLLREQGHAQPGDADEEAALTTKAREIAARFDARNGTSEQSRRVDEWLTAEPLPDHVPLDPRARHSPPPLPPAPLPPAHTPEELLDLAEEAWQRGRLDEARAAWERYDAGPQDPALEARRADGRGLTAMVAGDMERALAEWRRAADLHTDDDRRQSSLGRLGLLLCQLGQEAEGLPLVEESTARLDNPNAVTRLAHAYLAAGREDDAERVLAAAAPTGTGLLLLANLRGDAELALLARDALRAEDDREGLARACTLYAHILLNRGVDDEGVREVLAAYDEAIAHAPEAERAGVHHDRGGLKLQLGMVPEALDDLIEAVAQYVAVGTMEPVRYARLSLAEAYARLGRLAEAEITAEEALAAFREAGDDEVCEQIEAFISGLEEDG